MTNTQERVRDYIDNYLTDSTSISGTVLSRRLETAGLLAPNLPEGGESTAPGVKEWHITTGEQDGPIVWTAPNSPVMVQRIEPGDLTPREARALADSLYAAANYAEEGAE